MATVIRSPGLGASPANGKLRSTRGAVSSPAGFTCPARAFVVRFAFLASKPSCTRSPATRITGQGPASITVTGTCVPSASKTRVMPSLRPISAFMCGSLFDLDLHIHARRQIQLGQRIHRLRAGVEDVDHALVRLQLELLAALLVDVGAAQHRPQLPLGRERNRTRHLRPGLLRGAHNVRRRLIDQGVVKSFETDPDLARHGSSLLLDLRDDARADRPPTLTDREAQTLFHRDRRGSPHRPLSSVCPPPPPPPPP